MKTTGARTSWKWFAAWAAVGALYALSLTAVPVGVFLVPVPVVGTVLLTRRASAAAGWPGLLGGVSVLLFVLAYLNVGGPGNDCNTSDTGVTTCIDEANPWPFLAIGLVLVGLAVGLFLRMRARAVR